MIVVVSPESSAMGLGPDAVREAVAEELGAPALRAADPRAQGARGTLTVSLDAERRLVVAYRDAAGREVWRTIAVPDDPVAAVATVALLAGNLARDEAGELLAGLGVTAAAEPAPAPPPATTEETLALPPPPAAPVLVLPPPSTVAARPVAVPPAGAGPIDRGEDATDRDVPLPFRYRWDVFAAIGATLDFETDVYPRFEVQATHRWGPYALGLAFTTGSTTTFSPTSFEPDVTVSRNALLAVGEMRQDLGPLWLDVGLGLGLIILAMDGPASGSSVLLTHARIATTLGLPLGERFDVFARLDATTSFVTYDAGGTAHPYGPYDATGALGLRGRL